MTALVLLGSPDGTLREPPSFDLPEGVSGAATGDFNGDGLLDIAFSNASADTVSVLLSSFNGGLVRAGVSAAPHAGRIYSGDFNGDGKLDLFALSPNSGAYTVLLGHGDGKFTSTAEVSLQGLQVGSLTIADFNNDGKLDIVTGHISSRDLLYFGGNGDGTFQAVRAFTA